jgi:hypothetical protein
MFKDIEGYELNVKEYKRSVISNSFLNILNLFFGHLVIWIYAVFFIYMLNLTVGMLNTSLPDGVLFHKDAFDLVLTLVSFYIVIDLLVVCFSSEDVYGMRGNAINRKRNIYGAYWLLYLPLYLCVMDKIRKRNQAHL